ncbi:MAG: lipid II flippase Amj family protein [Clostridia bacterium]|nr:lipid II flippase Amj family protein [Clostridia bacterium]MDQ7791970.1 lipid II flippase Amj family protein [Clostridia bacterium]
MTRLLIVIALTSVIHLINTLIYSVRLSGVRTQRLATAISLFNVIFLISSTANMIQAPLLSAIVERSINTALDGVAVPGRLNEFVDTPAYQVQLGLLAEDIRLVILAATLGTIIGALMIPTFVRVFSRLILIFDEIGSVPRLVLLILFSPRRLRRAMDYVQVPSMSEIRRTAHERIGLPKGFLVFNVVVTGIYTTGVLSALYAGALFPDYRSTAVLLSAIVNGFATVLLATIVDPTAARITDQAIRGVRPERDVQMMVFWLAVSRLAGTVLAQLLFVPAALLIRFVAQLIV